MDLKETREWLKQRLSEEKYLHSLGVEETARELAIIFGEDEEKAALAGLVHDNAKGISYEELLKIVKANDFNITEDILTNKKILHAHVGACLAQKELGIVDAQLLDGIRYHTTGRPKMSLFEKIIFLSDKIEANTRNLEFRENILKILNETKNIDRAVLLCIGVTIKSLVDRQLSINPITIDVWNSYLLTA